MYHAGIPITSGTRYLLVGFSFVETLSLRTPGNLDCNFNALRGTHFPFGIYEANIGNMKALRGAAVDFAKGCNDSAFLYIFKVQNLNCLETFAKQVFLYHSKIMQCDVDKSRAVAEYWVQHLDEEGDEIPFHQDKDEALWKREGNIAFPAVATVTYLSDGEQPTVVSWGDEVIYSFPRARKHLAFKGDLHHGVPALHGSSQQRLTLLVNVWPKGLPSCRETGRSVSSDDSSILELEMEPLLWHEVGRSSLRSMRGMVDGMQSSTFLGFGNESCMNKIV